ncbi:hypothetical protein BerOc1_00975 [Pseudodesulfovibrio hydrargyri]|uniref:GIY-YIG domain-containing protein n=1 Tax=Pseudodesulfovibrio hydrargyri TaxID=2125990 RepID=A0A1J5N2N4_9BACT|nr:hypothetical protein [Pseudodesulfovibrio hydrargyri]OIQ49056.1 hypothetical protein BerOc1_00975 [Pseudodesulfovibrio hydrargyri]
MKNERYLVDHPLWRKKVDSSLFESRGTAIPKWASQMWGIPTLFSGCRSKKNQCSEVVIRYKGNGYAGFVTEKAKGRKTPHFRLWYEDDLLAQLKDVFLMSFMRDIERRLRKVRKGLEEEIPFWEFLDIEFDQARKEFFFTAHYTQLPTFPELFKRLASSPVIKEIDDAAFGKKRSRAYQQNWRPREELDYELGATNVIYYLIDTNKRELYVGEAGKLVQRLRQRYEVIPNWDYYRYEKLPAELADNRKTIEEVIIRAFAAVLPNRTRFQTKRIAEFMLVNRDVRG